MNEKQTEQMNVSRKRVLTAAIAIIAILAVVVGCLALSGCSKKKKTTDDATTSGFPLLQKAVLRAEEAPVEEARRQMT